MSFKKKREPIKKKSSCAGKVSQGQILAKGNVERYERLEYLIAREGYAALDQAIIGKYIFNYNYYCVAYGKLVESTCVHIE